MSVEAATYINDLQAVNPPSGDPVSQGDDHLRLLKTVLQNQFTGASRTFQIPSTLSKTANYSVVKADGESTIYCSTGAGSVTFTLPTLTAGDQGWKVHFIKTTSDVNPMFVAPPSGTINSGGISGLSQCRRCIPGVRITAIWDGANWFVTRALAIPIGSMLDFFSATLPAGYEWPNGQTLASVATNYPEYNSKNGSGTTLDLRGRVAVTLDNLGGSAAGRLAGGIITGTTVGNVGGTDTVTLTAGQIPSITSSGTTANSITVYPGGNSSLTVPVINSAFVWSVAATGGSGFFNALWPESGGANQTPSQVTAFTANNNITVNSTSSNTGGAAHSNCQPSIICAKILVVE